jgi:GWxTD domain-containing protein
MKKKLLFFLAISFSLFAFSNDLDAYFMYATFNSPEQSYIETYISTIGRTAVFKETEKGKYQAEIEITMLFKQNDSIVTFRKYTLTSPEIDDTLKNIPNFIDVQRIPLDYGIYNFELYIRDKNTDSKGFLFLDIIKIEFKNKKTEFSGIQLVEDFKTTELESLISKNGYDLVPYISDFYPDNMNRFIFYTEIYNTNLDFNEDFLVKYYIERYEDGKTIDQISRFKKFKPQNVIPLLGELNISDLYTGNYNFVIELRNRENELIANKKFFFQRSKAIKFDDDKKLADFELNRIFDGDFENTDSLREYIACLWPIAGTNQRNYINHQLKIAEKDHMKQFFYEFWHKYSPNPGEDWRSYKAQVDYVNKWYKTSISKGYQTDRGRVYLQYGTPNDIYKSQHEPSAYPYEIWHYYEAGQQRNRKFVFYNQSLVGENYELLHSNVIGELQTPNWERYLSKRNNSLYDFDLESSDDQWGSRAREEFDKR